MSESSNILEIEHYAHCLIGRLAVDHGFITAKDLLVALKTQHKEHKKKMGELLVELGYATNFQIEELLKFQKGMLKKVHTWNCLPDSLLKGLIYFQNPSFSFISIEDIKEAEAIREEQIIQQNQYKLLSDILEDKKSKQIIMQLKKTQSQVRLFYYGCIQCNRLYRLFNVNKIDDSLACPVCWDAPLKIYRPQIKNLAQENPEAVSQNEQNPSVSFESPEMQATYEVLKKMEPLRRAEIANQWGKEEENLTIKQVFLSLTRRLIQEEEAFVEEESKESNPDNSEVYVTRRIDMDEELPSPSETVSEEKKGDLESPVETISKEEKKVNPEPSSIPDSVQPSLGQILESEDFVEKESALKTLARKTRRFIKGEAPQLLLFQDMARVWIALTKKLVMEDDIVHAFFVQTQTPPGEKRKPLLDILREQNVLQEKHYQSLLKIQDQEIPAQTAWNNKKDVNFCHYLFGKEVVPKEDLQKLMLIQNGLYKLGIHRSYEDLLIYSKWLSKEMVQSLLDQFLGNSQSNIKEEPLPKTKTKVVFRMSILKSQTKGYHYSTIFLASLIIFGFVMIVIPWSASRHKKMPENTTQEASSSTPEKKISDSIPKKLIPETEKKEQPVLPAEKPARQNLVAVSVDGIAMIAIHQVLPKVTPIAQALQDNFKIFLQKPSLPDYVNNQLKWEAMVKYHIKEKLVSLDASYKNKEIKEKMEKLHLLLENFEKLGKGLLNYVESQKGNLEQKTFLKLLQASNTARYAAETENIFSELSGKKSIIYERN